MRATTLAQLDQQPTRRRSREAPQAGHPLKSNPAAPSARPFPDAAAGAYKALAADIAVLLTVFKESWPKVRQRTPVASEVLNDANDRAEELLEAVAPLKERAPATAREAGERRRRAFALLARAYLVSVGRRRVL